MLRRIRLRGYKSFDDMELTLGAFCVLFGPNAAGKSNFLDALQLLRGVTEGRVLGDAFEPPYRGHPLESVRFPPTGLRGLLAQPSATFTIEVDVELSPTIIAQVDRQIREMRQTRPAKEVRENETAYGEADRKSDYIRERFLRYRISVEILPRSGILRVADEYVAALTAKGEPKASRNAFLEQMDGKLHLRMEGQAHPTYHDLHLDHSILSMPLYAPHYPHISALKAEIASWSFFYFEPRERMRMASPVKEVRHIGLMGEELAAFLNTLKAMNEPQLRGIEKSLKAIIPSVTGIEVEVNDLGEVELRVREGGASIPARVVSEGTLRVLGLLSVGATKDPMGLVGFEEPENGVHPRRIRLIAELLKSRADQGDTQLIVTTHSPLLPDLIPDEHLYVCRKVEGCTIIEPLTCWGELARRRRTGKALDDDVEALQPSVSERILRGDFDA